MIGFRIESKTVARIFSVLSAVTFATGLMFVKLCKKTDVKAIIILRGIFNFILVYAHSTATKVPVFTDWQTASALLLRGVFCIMAIGGSFLITRFLKLAVFGVFTRLESIVLMLMGVLLMKNKFDWKIAVAVLLSIVGVTLVIAPSIFGFESTQQEDLSLQWNYQDIIGLLIGIVWMTGDVGQIILMAKILVGDISTQATIFFQCMTLVWFAGVWTICTETTQEFYLEEAWYYVGVIVSFYIAIFSLAESLRVEKNLGIQTVLESPYAISCFLFEAIIFQSGISFANWLGGLLVTACAVWSVLLAQHPEEDIQQSSKASEKIELDSKEAKRNAS